MVSVTVGDLPRTSTFYVRTETRRKLENEALPKVILTGGFSGGWNFGDLVQLKGTLRWHGSRNAAQVLCPVHILNGPLPPEYLARLYRTFATEDWLFYSREPAQGCTYAEESGLVPLETVTKGRVTLHVYGGGLFNVFWGEETLERIEQLLAYGAPQRYIVSGQQIERDFAPLVAEHCRRYRPDIIGCRDQESITALQQDGIDAQFSGDDALGELLEAARSSSPRPLKSWEERAARGPGAEGAGPELPTDGLDAPSPTFGLYLNSLGYVYRSGGSHLQEGAPENPFTKLDDYFRLLSKAFAADTEPLLITALHDDRPGVRDTAFTLRNTHFASFFPRTTSVDLVDLVTEDRLGEAAVLLRRCRLVVSTSYHVALLTKVLGRPVFVFAFNEYYRQKKQSLAEPPGGLADALAADPQKLAQEAGLFMQEQEQARAHWLAKLETTMATAPGPGLQLARATASLDHLLRVWSHVMPAGEPVSSHQRAQELEAQLHVLMGSRSWRMTAPYRRLALFLQRRGKSGQRQEHGRPQ